MPVGSIGVEKEVLGILLLLTMMLFAKYAGRAFVQEWR
jgi:hypothetical protein